jgi:hypothetical protein
VAVSVTTRAHLFDVHEAVPVSVQAGEALLNPRLHLRQRGGSVGAEAAGSLTLRTALRVPLTAIGPTFLDPRVALGVSRLAFLDRDPAVAVEIEPREPGCGAGLHLGEADASVAVGVQPGSLSLRGLSRRGAGDGQESEGE